MLASVYYDDVFHEGYYTAKSQLDSIIAEQANIIADKDNQIAEMDNQIADKDNQIAELKRLLAAMTN